MSRIIKTLVTKPWLSGRDDFGAPVDVRAFSLPQEKVALRIFFAVIASLFMLFIVGYRLRMVYADWVPLQEPITLWINTGFLVLASIALEWSRRALAAGNKQMGRQAFYAAGVFTFLFLTGQLAVWQQLNLQGNLVSSNPASSFFYLLTGVHGAHILGGLVAWARALPKLQHGADENQARMSVELCAVYWHFLLFIWAVLFYLLLSS